MNKRLFANLGFLLQISGLLTIPAIVTGLYFNETQAVVSLFFACVSFLACGFLLNALCERKDLDFKGSNFLFLAAFIVLPLIGALPYFYMDPFGSTNILEKFTNGYFESVSGFTTTGFSFIANPDILPKCLLIYRSLTELMGGVGIVFLLLAFFQSKKSLKILSNSVGVDNICGSLKKTYFSVFAIYGSYILIFSGIFFALGFTNIVNTSTFVIDTLTGGFSPSPVQFQQYLTLGPKICVIILMILGALNFAFNYHLFTRRLKAAFSPEIMLFLMIVVSGTIAVSVAANVGLFDSFFHVVSMSSSVGYNYIPISSFGNTALIILMVLMLIGGCAFSMAGGIRVSRLIALAKSVKEDFMHALGKNQISRKTRNNANAKGNLQNLPASFSILLFLVVLVVFALIFMTLGVSFRDALFEVGSALTTNGISLGLTTVAMPIGYKWLMIAAMTIGRVEVLSILIALVSLRKK
jgi:trk system potassium uptake protein